ncbi:hypothetical protein AMECASPLE_035049, partial [Ameca splendens]
MPEIKINFRCLGLLAVRFLAHHVLDSHRWKSFIHSHFLLSAPGSFLLEAARVQAMWRAEDLAVFVMCPPFILQGDNLGNTDEPSTSLYPYFVGNMATDSTMIDAAKAWECYIKQKHDRDRDRSTEHGCDKGRSCKDKDRGKKSSISSHN